MSTGSEADSVCIVYDSTVFSHNSIVNGYAIAGFRLQILSRLDKYLLSVLTLDLVVREYQLYGNRIAVRVSQMEAEFIIGKDGDVAYIFVKIKLDGFIQSYIGVAIFNR